jgi:phosphoglycolate phosphatase
MLEVLATLEQQQIIWGIVTNKPSRFTFEILKAMQLEERAAVIVCGDSLPKRKPHPDQILHACNALEQNPKECVYIGDTEIDVTASKAAGTKSLVAMYGYIAPNENPADWKADGYINKPLDIIDWLATHQRQ